MTSAWSAASSDLYTSSRALCAIIPSMGLVTERSRTRFFSDGLALAGNAPKIFARTSRNGLPYVSLAFCALFSTLAYMGVKTGSGKVFNWFSASELPTEFRWYPVD